MPWPSLPELPTELWEEILTLAAWHASESDKPWLCALSTLCWRSLYIARPALYDTVCITDDNLARITAVVSSGHFSLTRRLWIRVRSFYTARVFEILSKFPNVYHMAGRLEFLLLARPLESLALYAATVEAGSFELIYMTIRMHRVSSVRFTISSNVLEPLPRFAIPPVLQRVVLESAAHSWNHAQLCDFILPFFLDGEGVRRVVVSAAPDAADLPLLRAALEAYARAQSPEERRIWIIETPTDGRLLLHFRPGDTFNEELWEAGRPVLT